MGVSLRMRLHTLAILITYIRGVFLSCCSYKVVGDVHYKLTGEDPEMSQTLQCYDNCVYERLDQPGIKYCFKTGRFASFCTDSSFSSSVTTPAVTTPKVTTPTVTTPTVTTPTVTTPTVTTSITTTATTSTNSQPPGRFCVGYQ